MEDAAFHGATSPYPRYMDGLEMRVAASWGITVRPHFLPAWRFVLLGREDFFAAFRTTLDERAGKLTLEAYQDVERIGDVNDARVGKLVADVGAAA